MYHILEQAETETSHNTRLIIKTLHENCYYIRISENTIRKVTDCRSRTYL